MDSDRDALSIDKDLLDEAWEEQSDLYFHWAEKLADANESVETRKNRLDVAKAEASQEIRLNPEEYDLAKVTEDAVKNAVVLHPDVKKANRLLVKAIHKRDVVRAMVNALDHKKSALSKLVDLHGQNYFSSPRSSGENKEGMQQESKRKARSLGRRKRGDR